DRFAAHGRVGAEGVGRARGRRPAARRRGRAAPRGRGAGGAVSAPLAPARPATFPRPYARRRPGSSFTPPIRISAMQSPFRDISGVSIPSLAERHGTPVFVYDRATIEKRVSELKSFDVIRYAQKASSNIALLA